jgi:hypothetical protein
MNIREAPYAIVKFIEGEEYDIVPTNWLSTCGGKTKWPSRVCVKKVQTRAEPEENWSSFQIELLKFKGN